jgi:lipopolysaccharide biosynthesis protein
LSQSALRQGLVAERGSLDALAGQAGVAIVAHWAPAPNVSRSTSEFLRALHERGWATALVSTCEASGRLAAPDFVDAVLRRPNVGYDFGSWSAVLHSLPTLRGPVILANDSLAGPFGSLGGVLDAMDDSPAHVWGLVASGQFRWHLQSYFLRFCPGLMEQRSMRSFWRSVKPLPTKDEIIWRYELGLSRLAFAEGLRLDSFIPAGLVCAAELNPMMAGWRGALDAGLPMVKRELLRHPELVPDGAQVADALKARYGVDVWEWV